MTLIQYGINFSFFLISKNLLMDNLYGFYDGDIKIWNLSQEIFKSLEKFILD